ncbi:twin-arginine translocation pathway signal [Rhodopseudomonas sp. BR0M22]|uniref:twin-arginine translocation pathway signal n=1 Tax=Rhodopseudomonas sp. BR0M22 TaxID=2269369 RepID=UPI0013DFC76B|nr:twin-arginine translocation pathway signal [Rhodopseudomonas sp. BR0M22]NEW91356.1 twin-arginine translocation pathway signal [Rhodopseudomonas sp. BR0M22]
MTSQRQSDSAAARAAAAAALIAAALGLSGCAGMGDSAFSQAFVDPARYELYDCKQLEAERKSLDTQLAKLDGLMRKAQTGVAGPVVAEVAYRNDYINLKAQSRLAEQTWRDNRCTATPEPPPAAEPAAAKRARRGSR